VQTTCGERCSGGDSRKAGFFEDAGHLAEQIYRDAVGFAQLNAKRVQRKHRPLGEPATPFGSGGFVEISDN
jgi:hypothetical protein